MGLHLMEVVTIPIPSFGGMVQPRTRGLVGSFLLGLLFGVVSAPCAGPILVVLLTYLAGSGSSVAWGGTLLLVTGEFEPLLDRVSRELAGAYLLGVEVEAADRDGHPHRVDVHVNRDGVSVRARQQYVIGPASGSPGPAAAPPDAALALLASLRASTDSPDRPSPETEEQRRLVSSRRPGPSALSLY